LKDGKIVTLTDNRVVPCDFPKSCWQGSVLMSQRALEDLGGDPEQVAANVIAWHLFN